MRRLRRFFSTEIYFVTIRTAEQRFALSPYARSGAWQQDQHVLLDDEERHRMFERGRACVEETEALTDAIAHAEHDQTFARPEVPYDTFTDSIPNIIGSCLARGIEKFGVYLYGFVWMSNHGHLLLQAPRDNFAEFMAYLNGQIAVNVNRFLGRRHQLWARRYAAAQVLDEAEELERLGYLLANPQDAGVAVSIEDWPGVSSAAFFFQDHEQRFLCFDRTAWHKGGRPGDIAPFLSTIKLKHELLPQLAELDKKDLRQKIRCLIREKVKPSPIAITPADDDPVRALRRRFFARTLIPTDRSESSRCIRQKRSPQPLCHTTKPTLYKIYREWYRQFRIAYADSSRQYRLGNTDVEFPPGSFAPSKYPRARYSSNLDKCAMLHPTRKNLEIASARTSIQDRWMVGVKLE